MWRKLLQYFWIKSIINVDMLSGFIKWYKLWIADIQTYLVLFFSMQIICVPNFHSWFHHTICPSLTWSYCQDWGGHTFDASGKTRILTGNRSKPAGGADTPPCAILSGRFLEFWAKFELLGTFSPSCSAYNPHWNSFKGWFFGSHMAFTFSLGKPPPPPPKKKPLWTRLLLETPKGKLFSQGSCEDV